MGVAWHCRLYGTSRDALRRRAAWDGITGGRSGAVAVLQRFGGALNLNVHVHALVLDGCYAKDAAGHVAFHPVGDITTPDVAETLQDARVGITRLIERWRRDDVDMTSDVNCTAVPEGTFTYQQLFSCGCFGHTRVSAEMEPVTPTVDPAEIRGLGTT